MPQFIFSTAMTANQLGLNPLLGWQYEYLPWPAQVLLLVRSTTLATVSLSTLVRKRSENELRYRLVERLASLLPNSTHLLIRGSQQEEIALNWLLMKSLQVRLRSTES